MPEQWLPIKNYVGFYEVSNMGRVRNATTDRILRLSFDTGDYLKVNLCKFGKQRTHKVHTLVAQAFLDTQPPNTEVMHKDNNRSNAKADNLVWGTRTDNMSHKVTSGNHHSSQKTHCPRGHEHADYNNEPVAQRRGYRVCLACHKARQVARNMRRRGYEVPDPYALADDILQRLRDA